MTEVINYGHISTGTYLDQNTSRYRNSMSITSNEHTNTPIQVPYRRRGKLCVGKVLRIALYFVYRRKSFAMLILHTNLLLYKYKHVEANRRKSFAKFANFFPRVTFPAYGTLDNTRNT